MKEEIKERLLKHLSFLKNEVKDWKIYEEITWEIYNKDRRKRRELERWIENIINSSIDIAKLIIEMENLTLPETSQKLIEK